MKKGSLTVYMICLFATSIFITFTGCRDKSKPAPSITAFSIVAPAVDGIIDNTAHTVTINFTEATDLTNLIAEFTITGETLSVEGTEQVTGVTENNFHDSVTYTVTAENGTTQGYTVSVIIPCTDEDDCNSDQACSNNICTPCKCKELGGTCTLRTEDCAGGTFDWSTLECPGGRDEKCCLPDSSCSAIGGICTWWEDSCPDGYGAFGSLDCPDPPHNYCCVPVR